MKFHPLFTLESDLTDPEQAKEAESDIGYINVQRLQGGHYVSAGRLYEASELDSLQRFIAEFGGGQFKLYGRDMNNQGVIRQVIIRIDEQQHAPRFSPVAGMPAPAAGAGNLPAPPIPNPFGANSGLVELLAVLKQLNPPPPPPPTSDSAVLVALIQNMGANTQATMQMIAGQATQNLAAQVELVKALQQQPSGGNNPAAIQDSFMRGIQAMAQIAKDMKGEDGGSGGLTWEHLVTMFEKGAEAFGSAKTIIETVNATSSGAPAAAAAAPALATVAEGAHTAAAA